MSAPFRTRSRWLRPRSGADLAAAVLLAVFAASTVACSERDESPAPARPPTAESELAARLAAQILAQTPPLMAEDAEDKGYADVDELSELRMLGYLHASAKPRAARKEVLRLAIPAANAPDTGSLSELDHWNERNLSQRANEAFDYLGPQGFDADGEGARNAPASALRGAGRASVTTSAGEPLGGAAPLHAGREEVLRLRDRAEAHARTKALEPSQETRLRALGYHSPGDSKGRADKQAKSSTLSSAQRFERERRSLENLIFQSSSGYWANTYVPGDPVMRWLESRLEQRDRAALQALASRPLLLEAAAHQTPQPFDPPSSAALSIFLHADRRGLEHEERMLVQVGVQGAKRRGGLRPAMSVGIVLDARGNAGTEALASMRALVDAFLDAKDVGDRFSLTVAGKPGGKLVAADAFRHGPLSLAMSSLIESADPPSRKPVLGIVEAVRQTAAELQSVDDPTAPLGSSMVLLVTSQPFGPHADALAATAHESAVAGVPLSVVAIGTGVNLDEIERVTLAGQGNRRLLREPAEAEAVVDRELSALARVIARALRLNIRLAPGVKLIEVVGADRLDAAGAQRVRKAEQSIDRRLSRNLGIEKDRGEDEDGIQIVIPTFHSGDSHAVVLDVVASGPGPIADVTVRYKDLVYLRNSVARDNLTLTRNPDPPGPLERNVAKNFLAIRLASTLKQAGRSLLEGGDAEAIALVRDFQSLLESLQREVPGFQNDTDLATDTSMLEEYLALLETGILDQDAPRQYLADSLQLSGYFKTVPRSPSGVRTARR